MANDIINELETDAAVGSVRFGAILLEAGPSEEPLVEERGGRTASALQ